MVGWLRWTVAQDCSGSGLGVWSSGFGFKFQVSGCFPDLAEIYCTSNCTGSSFRGGCGDVRSYTQGVACPSGYMSFE